MCQRCSGTGVLGEALGCPVCGGRGVVPAPDADQTRMLIKLRKLVPNARIPTLGTAGAAGFDLYATHAVKLPRTHEGVLVHCGVAVQIPDGYVGLVCSRSGLARKYGVIVLNAPGVIDSDFRGELCALLISTRNRDVVIREGDRVAQLVILPTPRVEFLEVDDLSETERGAKGWGSTGQGGSPVPPSGRRLAGSWPVLASSEAQALLDALPKPTR